MIEFTCFECNKQLRVKDDAAGQTGKCPSCGAKIQVPMELVVDTETPSELKQDVKLKPVNVSSGSALIQPSRKVNKDDFSTATRFSFVAMGVGLMTLALSPLLRWLNIAGGGVTGISGNGKYFFIAALVAVVVYCVAVLRNRFLTGVLITVAAWATFATMYLGTMLWRLATLISEPDLKENPFAALIFTQVSPGAGLYAGLAGALCVLGAFGYLFADEFSFLRRLWHFYVSQIAAIVLAGLILGGLWSDDNTTSLSHGNTPEDIDDEISGASSDTKMDWDSFFEQSESSIEGEKVPISKSYSAAQDEPAMPVESEHPKQTDVDTESAEQLRAERALQAAIKASEMERHKKEAAAKVKREYLPNVKLSNVRTGKSILDQPGVFGELKNTGDRTLSEVAITIYLLDSTGKPISESVHNPVYKSNWSMRDYVPLRPNYSEKFGYKIEPTSDWAGEIDVIVSQIAFAEPTESEFPAQLDEAKRNYLPNLSLLNVREGESTLGERGVFGELKNTGNRTLNKVKIIVYCLNKQGQHVYEKTFHPVFVSEERYSINSDDPLKPNYTEKFGVKMENAPSEWTGDIEVSVIDLVFAE